MQAKFKRLATGFMSLLITVPAPALDPVDKPLLIEKDGKIGLIDHTGKVLLEPTYEQMYDFSEGLFVVRLNGKEGYIDSTGRIAISLQYMVASAFHEGIAAVSLGHEYTRAYIDKTNHIVIPDTAGATAEFSEGRVAFQAANKLFGFLDQSGKIVVEPTWQSVGHFKNGLAPVQDAQRRWGYINREGRLVIQPQPLDTAGDFEAGFAAVTVGGVETHMDKTGLIHHELDGVQLVSEGLAVKESSGRKGCIDAAGQWVIPPKYTYIGRFNDGVAPASQQSPRNGASDEWVVIDKTGKVIVGPQYHGITTFKDGLAVVSTGDLHMPLLGLIDATGKIVLEPKFDLLERLDDGVFKARSNGIDLYLDSHLQVIWKSK